MSFSTRLRELRLEHNFTQKELSQHLSLSPNIICEWEKGRCSPSIESLKTLSSLFECSIDYLVDNSDDLGVISISSQAKNVVELSPDGKELIEMFDGLEKEYRAQILEYVRFIAQRRDVARFGDSISTFSRRDQRREERPAAFRFNPYIFAPLAAHTARNVLERKAR